MHTSDDFELLSRFVAGELSAAEAEALQARVARDPDLGAALEAMRALSLEAKHLPSTLSDQRAATLVRGALGPTHRNSSRILAFVGLVAGALVVLIAVSQRPPARPTVVVMGGEATLSGQVLEVGRAQPVALGDTMLARAHGAVLAMSGEDVAMLARNSALKSTSRGFELVSGAVVLSSGSSELEVQAGDDLVHLRGQAVLLMEPAHEVVRVTEALTPPHSENTLKTSWMMLGPAVAGAAVGATLTLFVVHGEATVAAANSNAALVAHVDTGERWGHGEPRGKPLRAALTFAASATPQLAPGLDTRTAIASNEPAELASLTRAQLVERIGALRDVQEQLLRERAELKKTLADESGEPHHSRNYYRLTPEELAQSAQNGELHLRLNIDRPEYKVKKEVAERAGLTAAEEAALKQIYADSGVRLHNGLVDAYRQMGGDPNLAQTFTNFALIEELKSKSLKDDYADSIRQVANERAGLVAGDPTSGSALLKAYRLLWAEDDRTVLEVEALLGPARAESFLNDKDAEHANLSWGVGPAKK